MKYPLFKTLLIVLPLSFSNFNTIAQQPSSNFFIEAAIGASVPVGKFGAKEIVNRNNPPKALEGYAKTGFVGNIAVGYHLNSSFGITASFNQSFNALSKKTFADYWNTDEENVNLSADNWKISSYMAGLFYSFQPTGANKLAIRPTVQAGVCSARIPDYKASSNSGNNITYLGGKLKNTLCYRAGLDIMYMPAEKLYLLSGLNFFNSASAEATNTADKRAYKMSSLNLTVGAGIRLN